MLPAKRGFSSAKEVDQSQSWGLCAGKAWARGKKALWEILDPELEQELAFSFEPFL